MKLTELFSSKESVQTKKFVVTSEIGPPKGCQIDKCLNEAQHLKSKVDAINVTDNQSSVMRFGSLATCHFLKDRGIEPVFQVVCRDRNRIALQSDILSAAAFGIENLLLLTGDHTKLGDHPQAKPVFDLDAVSLIYAVKKLEEGVDLAGNKLEGEPPKFSIGAVVSPCSDPIEPQLIKMEKKVKAGAEFFQTQAVYEVEKFIKFMEKVRRGGFEVPVMAGIVVLKSVGMAKYMNENVAGVYVPDNLIEELKKDKEKTKSGQTGIEIAARLIKELKPYCQGVHIMPLGWGDKVPKILELAGL
ncbi:MAG: methylenetetrahydrofolate reductase [Elusimicrobiota bacterium]